MSWGVDAVGFLDLVSGISDLINITLKDDVVYVVGTNVEYGIYVEFGLKTNPNYPAQPYLLPAARSVEREMGNVARHAESVEDAAKLVTLEIERRAAQNAPVDTGNLQASIRSERIR